MRAPAAALPAEFMIRKQFMLIAGEPSGDTLAAELVGALRAAVGRRSTYSLDRQPLESDLAPRFFGAGGPRMAAAGVDLAVDMMPHAVTGLSEVLRNLAKFRALMLQLTDLAVARQPDAIICVDYSGFNRRLGARIAAHVRTHSGTFNNWRPRIIQYVSPQIWASREGRAYQVARDFDFLLSIFPFEKDWYAKRVPNFRVEFVGHPMIDRYGAAGLQRSFGSNSPLVLLLPGSRIAELRRHIPVMLGALDKIRASIPNVRARMVLPVEALLVQARGMSIPANVELRTGALEDSLREADLAISKTGTITMECAFFGVPAVTMYKTSFANYEVGKRLVKVKSLTMPNLLANETLFPEFVQNDATPDNLARAAIELLKDQPRRERIRSRLKDVVASLGGPGASRRAAEAILKILP